MSILLLFYYLDNSLSLKQMPPPQLYFGYSVGKKVSPFGFDIILSEYNAYTFSIVCSRHTSWYEKISKLTNQIMQIK